MKFFTKAKESIDSLLGLAGLVGIVIMTISVVLRYVFKISLSWSDEFLRTLCIYTYFIGAAMCLADGSLMRLELLDSHFEKKNKPKGLLVVKKVQYALQAVIFTAFSYQMIRMVLGMVGQTTTTSNTPAWVSPLGAAIGLVLLALISIYRLIKREKA